MDYDRVEILAKKLLHPRMEIRLRSASSILFKLESGIFDRRDIAQASFRCTLLDGVNKSISIIISQQSTIEHIADATSETYQLVLLLLSILRLATYQQQLSIPERRSSTDDSTSCTMILDHLYSMKAISGIDNKLNKMLDEVAHHMIVELRQLHYCRHAGMSEESIYISRVQSDQLMKSRVVAGVEGGVPIASSKQQLGLHMGAGAVLNSRLCYSGWRFASFSIAEDSSDDEWLFDLEVKIKLRHETTSTEIWSYLVNFPVEAIVQKTNILHAMLDVVGGPSSHRDIDSDPLGLHSATAIRWFTALLLKCRDAFALQLEGSLCCYVPAAASDPLQRVAADDLGPTDITMQLAQAMFALRHPKIHQLSGDNVDSKPGLGLVPTPSYPGLAFACCAASMPLLQMRDADVARLVYSLLQVALPQLIEPRLRSCSRDDDPNGNSVHHLSDIESARFQHLFNRVEQVLSLFDDLFDFKGFLSSVYSDDEDPSASEAALEQSSFDILFLSTVTILFNAVPTSCLIYLQSERVPTFGITIKEGSGTSSGCGQERQQQVVVGEKALQCLRRMASCRPLWAFLPPQSSDTILRCLKQLDEEYLSTIYHVECILESATNLTSGSRWPDSRAMLINFLLANAEKFIGMLDNGRHMETAMVIGQGSLVLCAVLPVLLEAVVVAESDGPPLCASTSSVLNMMLRVLACGAHQECKLHLLHSMVLWIGQSAMAECLSGVRAKLLLAFSFQPSSRRLLLSSLCTPQIFHVLLMGCLENEFHENEENINHALTLTSYSLHCLELLSEYILNHDSHLRCDEQSLPLWSTVLPALKLLEWNRHNGVVSSTSVKRVLQLSQHIEDICRNSTYVACRRSVSKTLVMGLFHNSKVVRVQCSLLIHRQLRLVTGEQYNLDIAGNNQSPTGRDPFHTGGGNMQLTGWKFSSALSVRSSLNKNIGIHPREKSLVQAESSAKRGCFTHLDVRRVASLGLGCDESEPSLRASACNQLLDMLCGDDQLVRTADLSWAVLTTKQALRTVEKLFASRFRVDRVSITAGDESLSAAQRGLLVAAVKLSIFLTARVAAIRKMASLFDSDDASSDTEVRESISLQILVELCLLSTFTAASGSETFQIVKCLSAQFLCSLCCSAETWCISTGSEADSIVCGIQPILEPTTERDQHSDVDLAARSLSACLLIPSFLRSSLCFPSFRHDVAAADDRREPSSSSSSSSIFPDLCVLLPARLSYNVVGILRQPSFPADNIMTIITESCMAPSVDRTHVATVTKLFQSIVNARHHTQLRRGLNFTSCIFNSNIDILKIFLCLQISLTTAVSNIVTIIPRTHKDHLTLNSVLVFLNDVFQSFKVHFPSVTSSDSEFITLYHESLKAVLPSMEHHFESHFTTKLSVTIPQQLDNIDSDSTIQTEYLSVTTRSVSLSYFKLLLTLSSFIDLDRKLMFGESLMGSKLPSHLIGCFCNETHPYWSRFMAICTLGNLLRHHSGWESLISVKYEGIIDCGNMIDRLVRLLRLLRTPDSMIGSCVVVGALRLLYLILVEQARDLHLYFSVLQLEHDWNWLLRFIYDRRSEVKVLTLKIIDILVSNAQRSVDYDGISVSTIDSLEDIDIDTAAPTAVPDERSNRNILWPPHELLLYIIMDRVESISVRLQAVGIIISQWTTNGVKSSDLSIVSHVLSLIEECLSLRQFHSSASSVQGSLTCLMNLLQVQGCGPSTSRDDSVTLTILSVVRSKKIPGQIIELLDSSNYDNLLHKAMLRVGITANEYDYSHDSSDYYPGSVQSIKSSKEQQSLIGDGWNNFLQRLELVECLSWRAVTLSVCSFFVFFSRLDSSAFGQCLLHSNLLFQLTTSFSSVRDITFNPKLVAVRQAVRFRIDLATISAQAELISLLINHQNKLADKVVDNFIQRNNLVPSNLLKKITLVLGQILMWYEANDQSESQSAAQQCLNSCLRLLTLLLNDSLRWFNLSGHLESQQGNSAPTSEQLNFTFELLLDLRFIISSRCLPDEQSVLAARLDVTIAHFMQLSEEARYAFVGYRMKMREQSSESRSSLFKQYVSSIAAATESIWCAPPIAAAANNNSLNNSSSRNNNNNDTNVKHSLLTLKNRSRHGKGASSRSTMSSRDYSPSLHSNGTYSSKWRTKTRSYVWRKEGDNHGQLSVSELTDQLKLQLWSALLVLSASLTRNEEATNWAIELNLHNNLEKLLRFAARYSLTNTLSPPTLEAIAIGSSWTPSLGMIASAIYALSSSFSSYNVGAKHHFLCKGVAASAAVVKNDEASQRHESNGSVLHHLLSVGVNRSTLPVARWLSLGLVGSILSSSAHSTSGGHQTVLKATISQILVLSAQQSVNSSAIDCDTVVHFLNTLTSILSSDDDITCLMQLSNKDSLSHVRSFHLSLCAKSPTEVSSESFKIMTFPEVIQWIWANSNSDRAAFDVAGMNCLAAATGRLVGRIGIVDRSNKTIGNILSEETLSVLSECFLPNINGRFVLGHIARAISALSLWNIVHHSEKAKCLVREILRHRGRGAPAGIPIKHAEKAELCLLSLIAN